MALWTSSHLLVYSSRSAGYNATSLVLLTEAVKLCLAVAMYRLQDGGFRELWRLWSSELRVLLRYAIPAGCGGMSTWLLCSLKKVKRNT